MKRGSSCTLPLLILGLLGLLAPALGAQEARGTNIDVVLLVDKSLSMVGAVAAAKRYAAGQIIGPVLVPGDRLIIETFYGKIDRLYGGTIRSEEDKSAIVRSLNALVANGRFTDIGLALDRAREDIAELGAPERPKYVLLLTDERQEAPAGTKYFSPTYTLDHPALKYVKRVDLGSFRAITVGLDVGEKIDAATPGVMRLLTDPPPRSAKDFPSLPEGTDPGLSGAVNASTVAEEADSGAPRTGGQGLVGLALPAGAVLLVLVLAIALIRIVQLRKRKRKDQEGP